MAYVIGQPCIDVKDSACVDACPVDAIHSIEGAPQFYIEPATCIDCDACLPACPVNAIWPGDDVPEEQKKFIEINANFYDGFDKSKSTTYTRKRKTPDGETAVAEGGEAPPPDAAAPKTAADVTWTEVEGWEARWAAHEGGTEDRVEIQKRYGRVRSVIEEKDKYTIRIFLPERLPTHPFRFRYGLPDEMCGYDVTADVSGSQGRVGGKVEDPSIAKLCGYANSFPDRFLIEYTFDVPVISASVQKRGSHVVDVVFRKAADASKAA